MHPADRLLVVDGAALVTGRWRPGSRSLAGELCTSTIAISQSGCASMAARSSSPTSRRQSSTADIYRLKGPRCRRYSGEVDKIGLVCLIAEQAFVGRLLSDLWFQWLSGFPLRDLSVRDLLCAGDDVLLARGGALSFCSRRVRLLRHQIVTAVFFASKRSVGCLDAAIYSLSEHHTLIASLRIA